MAGQYFISFVLSFGLKQSPELRVAAQLAKCPMISNAVYAQADIRNAFDSIGQFDNAAIIAGATIYFQDWKYAGSQPTVPEFHRMKTIYCLSRYLFEYNDIVRAIDRKCWVWGKRPIEEWESNKASWPWAKNSQGDLIIKGGFFGHAGDFPPVLDDLIELGKKGTRRVSLVANPIGFGEV